MTSAYDVPALRQLIRTLTLTRTKGRSVTIHDAYALQAPTQVDEALITVGDWKKVDDTTLQFSQGGSTLNVQIRCPVPYTLTPEHMDEYGRPFTRIGIAATLSDGQSFEFVITPMEK